MLSSLPVQQRFHAQIVKQRAQNYESKHNSFQMHSLTWQSGRIHHKSHAVRDQGRQPGSGEHSGGAKNLPYAEVDEAIEQIGHGRFQVLLLSCISLVWAGDAAEVMVLSYLGPAASCNFGFDNPTSQALLTSTVFGGMLLGAACWGFLGDELGRRRALLTSIVVVVAAGLASCAAPTPTLLLLSRACVGFGLAGAPVAFTLMMELLPAKSRALWGVLIELAWTVGTVAEAALAWAVLNSQGWRLLLLLSTLPLAVLLVLARWLPESPRWLLAQGDATGAAATLQSIARTNSKPALHLPQLTAAAVALAAGAPASPSTQQLPGSHGSLDGNAESLHGEVSPESAALLSGPSCSSSTGATQHPQPKQHQHGQHQHQHLHQHLHLDAVAGGTPDQGSHLSTHNTPASHHADHHHHNQKQQQVSNTAWQPWSSSFKTLIAEVQHSLSLLWGGPHASTTSLLVFSWAAVACAYYGLVQLEGQLHIQAAGAAAAAGGSATSPACVDGKLQVPGSNYAAVMTTAAAEVPAVVWAAAVSKGYGGHTALVSSLVLGCACLLPSIIGSMLPAAGVAHAAGGADTSWSSNITEVSMFGSRLFISAAFSLLWVFTPSLFSTRVRGFGLGISNASARIGGLLSPFIAINLAVAAGPAAAEALFAGLCLAAVGAVMSMPHQQASTEQQLEEEDEGAVH